jgi:hypothetical protein
MKSFVVGLLLQASTMMLAQTNPVPFVNQPLVPSAIAPGGPSFTLTVNGTGFVSGSTVNWNGTALATTFVSSSQLTAKVPVANIATASTAWITVSSPTPGGGASSVVFLPISNPTSLQFTSFPVSSLNLGPAVAQPIAADFNGDRKLDFVENLFQEENDYFLYTFLGNGDGSFQPVYNEQGVAAFASGDFTGDGTLDLVGTYPCIGCEEGEVQANFDMLLGNGNGTFSAGAFNSSSAAELPDDTNQLVTGDFNGDGRLDAALALSEGIYVYLGNGDGTFQNPSISSIGNFDVLGGVGDFNGDGKLDLIGVTGTQLAFLQGNGDGTFQTPSTYYSLGSDTQRIIAADLNGDDKLDLITVQNSPTNTFTVFLGNGDGTFKAGVSYPIGSALSGGVIGDLGADGKLDLALFNQTNTIVLPGNGDGTFQTQAPIDIPAGSCTAFDGAVGDFNNDGKLDLISVCSNGGPVILGQGPSPVAHASPTSLTWDNQVIGTSSTQVVTVSNTGIATLTLKSVSVTGANASDFAVTNPCSSTLAVNASCQISVKFTPSAAGSLSATLTITSNGFASSSLSIPLNGTGISPSSLPSLSPTTVIFPGQYVGTSGLPQQVTLTNPASNGTISIASVTAAPSTDFAAVSSCGGSIAGGASCSITVFFDPSASGTRTGTLTVTDSASNSPQIAALTGTGQDFSMSSSSSSATVSPGQTATYELTVASIGGFNQKVTFSCSGAPNLADCSVGPSSLTLNGSSASTATVTVTTMGSAMGMTQPFGGSPTGSMFGSWLALSGTLGLVMIVSGVRSRSNVLRRLAPYGLAMILLLSIGVTMPSCGGGGNSNSGGGGTPAGSYTLTVTGTFTGSSTTLNHTTKLTLIVK